MWRLCDLQDGVDVSPGFCLLAAWFAVDNGWGLLGIVLGAAALHEMGHCLMLVLLGVPITGLRIGAFGAELTADRSRLSYAAELAVILAGPGINLLCAVLLTLLGGMRWEVFIGANLVLCVFNLLPVRPLDGGRALELLVIWAAGPAVGEQAARWSGGTAALALSVLLAWVMVRTGGSLWLLPAAAGLLSAAVREIVGGNWRFL